MTKRNISKFEVPFEMDDAGRKHFIRDTSYGFWEPNPAGGYRKKKIPTEPNAPFNATMKFVDWFHSQNSVWMAMEDEATGNTYPLFGGEIFEVIKKSEKGRVEGHWQVSKRGTKYGLVYHGDPK